MRLKEEIKAYHQAGYAALYVVTPEERRAEREILAMAKARKSEMWRWSVTQGWREVTNGENGGNKKEANDPYRALEIVRDMADEAILVLRDFHFFIESPEIIRLLRDLIPICEASGRLLVILAARLVLPPELEKDMTVIDFRLPDREELGGILDKIVDSVKEKKIQVKNKDRLVEASLGMTETEARNAFALAIVRHKKLNEEAVSTIHTQKAQVVKKSGLLEVIESAESMESIGGLDLLKEWLKSRAKAFGEDARKFGLPVPKGMLALGVPGVGKSLTAKCVAKSWNLPLLRLDIGRIFGGIVGESEANMRNALRLAEDMSPTVLWVDEIEKGAAGLASSGQTDSGVTARVVGTLLTWLQEKTAPVFLFATANRVSALPPELLRKGRFDEIFWMDLPTQRERKEIVEIHTRKRKKEFSPMEIDQLATATNDFTGAEIEQVVIEGMFYAFDGQRELTIDDLLIASKATIPLSTTMAEDIGRMRSWAKTRARRASRELREDTPVGRRLEVGDDG